MSQSIQIISGRTTGIILLEAGTIVGPTAGKLRVAKATLERKIVTKYNIFPRPKHFLVLDGYDPRIHTLYFCPQLYAYDSDNKLVAIEGEEIGKLLAETVQHGVKERQPWYEPSDKVPNQPIISTTMDTNFDTLIVDRPVAHAPTRNATSELTTFESAHAHTEEILEHRAG